MVKGLGSVIFHPPEIFRPRCPAEIHLGWIAYDFPRNGDGYMLSYMGVSKNRVPQNGWFIMEHPI